MTRFSCAVLGMTLAASATAQAATIGYWRFEGDDFLADSSPSGLTLATSGTAPTQVANSTVASFDNPVPQSQDANASVAYLGGDGNFSQNDPDDKLNVSTTGFTIEAYFRKTANTSGTQYIASHNRASTGQRSWGIGFFGTNATNNNLFVILSDTGNASTVYNTEYTISNDTDYYVAWTHNPTTGTSNVYLTKVGEELGTPDTFATLTGLQNTPAPFRIGATGNNENRFNGYVDELRLSSGIVPEGELLAVVPEPGSVMVLGSALACLGLRRRSR